MPPLHTSLTASQKQTIIFEHKRRVSNNGTFTQQRMALWTKEKINHSEAPKQGTVSRILGSSARLLNHPTHLSNMRKHCFAKYPKLERQLYEWISEQNAKNVAVSGAIVRAYGERLQTEAKNQ